VQELSLPTSSPTILCLGAHSDDIEIGCGGALVRLLAKMPQASVHWVVFSAEGDRADEARHGAKLFAGERLESIELHSFRDGFFPDSFGEIKERFRDLQKAVDPDLVFTTWRRDLHQDHRLISELSSQTFRNHVILEYEISKYDGDLGSPNVYVRLDTEEADRKVENLMTVFGSQHDKYWFSRETFRALMRVRGVECRSSSGYAEAFYGHKLVFGAGAPA
jgi:LmbE family N-acetylglucosaminyl deacetylase